MTGFWKIWCVCGCFAMLTAGCTSVQETESVPVETETQIFEEVTEHTETDSLHLFHDRMDLNAQWELLAREYEAQTGVVITVTAAEPENYAAILSQAMQGEQEPSIFNISRRLELETWREYCYDWKENPDAAGILEERFLSDAENESKAGIGYSVGTYGLLYNRALLKEYCELEDSVILAPEDITDFGVLRAVAEDIQARKKLLGVQGAFASAGTGTSQEPGIMRYFLNLPYAYSDVQSEKTAADLEAFGSFLTCYTKNSVSTAEMLPGKSVRDALMEFAFGEAVFCPAGTWVYPDLTGNAVADKDLGILPLYMGIEGETEKGLCCGYRDYLCVNKNMSAEEIEAAVQFLTWVFSEDGGKQIVDLDMPSFNPLEDAASAYAAKESVDWKFMEYPSENWTMLVESALIQYAEGILDWEEVEDIWLLTE